MSHDSKIDEILIIDLGEQFLHIQWKAPVLIGNSSNNSTEH